MDMKTRQQIIDLLKAKFLPLDYGNWQPDELFEQILSVIADPEHVVGNEPMSQVTDRVYKSANEYGG